MVGGSGRTVHLLPSSRDGSARLLSITPRRVDGLEKVRKFRYRWQTKGVEPDMRHLPEGNRVSVTDR